MGNFKKREWKKGRVPGGFRSERVGSPLAVKKELFKP